MSELVSPFGLSDVRSQFATTTRSNLSNDNSMRAMYTKVFDSATTGDRLSDFGGTGQPEPTNQAMGQECSGGSFRPVFNGNIDFYGGPTADGFCSYRWKYDTDPLFPSPSFTTSQTASANGSVGDSPASFDFADGTTVYSEMQVWNEYNEDATSDYNETLSGNSITFSIGTLTTPDMSSGTVEDDDNEFYLEFAYADGADVSSWRVEMRVNGTPSSQNPQTVNCTDFNSGTNTQGIQGQMNPLGDPGDTIEFRVRANGDACHDDSSFSDWVTSADGVMPSCPITV